MMVNAPVARDFENRLSAFGVSELGIEEQVATDGGAAPVVIYVGIKASTVFKAAIGAAAAGFAAGYGS